MILRVFPKYISLSMETVQDLSWLRCNGLVKQGDSITLVIEMSGDPESPGEVFLSNDPNPLPIGECVPAGTEIP